MRFSMKTLLAAAVLAAPFATPAMAETWTVDHDQSTLGFEVPQGGKTLSGTFESWTASIDFDPEAPEDALITVEIDTGSAATGNGQYDGMLETSDWFSVKEFGSADFTTDNVLVLDDGTYKADGLLTIKAVTLPIELGFTLDIDGDTAHVVGQATLDRKEYNLGPAVNADTVGETVTVLLDLTAMR
ncbi:YceI family protein [Martelella radicis]|uniref:Polyisoprenoid-binding protein YceI n=1 Tax=Martelella radicis TaxID=1397476 RepID=A0A7W6KIX7_9HYPH|nr:YceI family protein [Martelella radicis]MBB4122174.1 polyisoprenoid-binding protein YceI [Martelella radicis]